MLIKASAKIVEADQCRNRADAGSAIGGYYETQREDQHLDQQLKQCHPSPSATTSEKGHNCLDSLENFPGSTYGTFRNAKQATLSILRAFRIFEYLCVLRNAEW